MCRLQRVQAVFTWFQKHQAAFLACWEYRHAHSGPKGTLTNTSAPSHTHVHKCKRYGKLVSQVLLFIPQVFPPFLFRAVSAAAQGAEWQIHNRGIIKNQFMKNLVKLLLIFGERCNNTRWRCLWSVKPSRRSTKTLEWISTILIQYFDVLVRNKGRQRFYLLIALTPAFGNVQ